jgi:hypothetical protein
MSRLAGNGVVHVEQEIIDMAGQLHYTQRTQLETLLEFSLR